MEYIHEQRNISNTPRKLRLVADMVRKLEPQRAIDILTFTNKAAALPLAKAIKTALANTGNRDGLAFKKIEINEGMKLKRYKAGTAGRGRGRPYKRRMSNIKIVLTDEVVMMENSKNSKQDKKVKGGNDEKVVMDNSAE